MAEIESVLQIPNQETPSEENLLVGHLRRIEDDRAGNYAIHVHMSELRPHYRQPHYLRVASRAFDSLVINFDVTLYSLTNTDMVLVCHEVPVEEIDPPLYKLRALFNEDPLTFGEEGSLDDRFTTWYDLAQPADFSTFISVAEELEKEALADNRKAGDSRHQEMARVPLDPTNLTRYHCGGFRASALPISFASSNGGGNSSRCQGRHPVSRDIRGDERIAETHRTKRQSVRQPLAVPIPDRDPGPPRPFGDCSARYEHYERRDQSQPQISAPFSRRGSRISTKRRGTSPTSSSSRCRRLTYSRI